MIEFICEQHIYLKDGIILPSVSQILHFIFPDKYKNIDKAILNKKAEYGTVIHKAIECLENGEEMPKLTYIQEESINQYLKLKKKYNIAVLEQEQIVSYEYDYCGRFDMIANIDNYYSLADIKTTAELDKEYLSWQLSFYELASKKTFGKFYVIWLPKKELGQVVEIERKSKKELLKVLDDYLKEIKEE
jgi:hypothetical protein